MCCMSIQFLFNLAPPVTPCIQCTHHMLAARSGRGTLAPSPSPFITEGTRRKGLFHLSSGSTQSPDLTSPDHVRTLHLWCRSVYSLSLSLSITCVLYTYGAVLFTLSLSLSLSLRVVKLFIALHIQKAMRCERGTR